MFKKKSTPVNSVADAIAPFALVRDNLMLVVGTNDRRRELARKRIEDARVYATTVEENEKAEDAKASAEIEMALKIAMALNNILGETPTPVSVPSQDGIPVIDAIPS